MLVAALETPDITPDALGSLAAGSILVTRHLKKSGHPGFEGILFSLALCRPACSARPNRDGLSGVCPVPGA